MAAPHPTESLALHERLPATVQSVAHARAASRRFAADLDVDLSGIALAVSEAVANVVAHAYEPGVEGTVDLTGRATPYEVAITVRDRGRGLESQSVGGAGFGLQIIRRLAQHVEVVDSREGVAVTMRFRRGGAWSSH